MLMRFHGAAEPAMKYSLKYALRYIDNVLTRTVHASENVIIITSLCSITLAVEFSCMCSTMHAY